MEVLWCFFFFFPNLFQKVSTRGFEMHQSPGKKVNLLIHWFTHARDSQEWAILSGFLIALFWPMPLWKEAAVTKSLKRELSVGAAWFSWRIRNKIIDRVFTGKKTPKTFKKLAILLMAKIYKGFTKSFSNINMIADFYTFEFYLACFRGITEYIRSSFVRGLLKHLSFSQHV